MSICMCKNKILNDDLFLIVLFFYTKMKFELECICDAFNI